MQPKAGGETVETVLKAATHAFATHVPRRPGERLVVAVSGGMDSMVLLDVLLRLQPSLDVDLHIAHLDHGLRSDAAADRRFVADYARTRQVPCTCARRGVYERAIQQGLSLETAAREVRYQFLDEVAASCQSRYIVLGHQADDQAETVLLRLIRGSGSTGLAGMRPVRGQRYVRPLLEVDRQTIRHYAVTVSVPYREDASNQDLRFARNRIRHQVLPQLRQHNPRIVATLGRTARLLADEDDCLDQLASKALACTLVPPPVPGLDTGKAALDVSRLVEYHIAVQRRVVRAVLTGQEPDSVPPGYTVLEGVLQLTGVGASGMRALSDQLVAQRTGNWLILGRKVVEPVDCAVPVPGQVMVASRSLLLRTRLGKPENLAPGRPGDGVHRAVFDVEHTGARLRLRSLQAGDAFQPHGMEGRKKLSDLLIDLKWPRLLRQGLLVLTGPDDAILWVVGLRTAHACRVTARTRACVVAELSPVAC